MRKGQIVSGWIAVLTIAGAAWAQQQPSPISGRVTAADVAARTFVVATPTGDIAFKANDRTVFTRMDALAELSNLKVGEEIRVVPAASPRGRIAARVETVGSGTAQGKTVTGSVAAVDVSESRVTIDMPQGATALKTINAGDPVRIQVSPGAALANRIDVLSSGSQDDGILGANGSRVRRSLGLWLLAMAGTMVALRARRLRLV
jgi:hypothetical protein